VKKKKRFNFHFCCCLSFFLNRIAVILFAENLSYFSGPYVAGCRYVSVAALKEEGDTILFLGAE
jgi:hypothetical protein